MSGESELAMGLTIAGKVRLLTFRPTPEGYRPSWLWLPGCPSYPVCPPCCWWPGGTAANAADAVARANNIAASAVKISFFKVGYLLTYQLIRNGIRWPALYGH